MTTTKRTLETPNYFEGQRLTARTLNKNVATERERRRVHNRSLHGTGISWGLSMLAEVGEVEVIVEAGHAIDGNGEDLILTAPVTVQVPPVPGAPDQPDTFILIARWSDQPESITGTGPCNASGVVAWSEEPIIEFVSEANFAGIASQVVALGSVDVLACVIEGFSLGKRRVLGERRLPHVDGGVYTPSTKGPGSWELVRTAGTPYGLRTRVNTSIAGFTSVPNYQARVSGRRWGTEESGSASREFVLWTADANIIEQTPTSLTLEVLIPSVQVRSSTVPAAAAPSGSFQTQSLDDFLGDDEDSLIPLVVGLGWGVTWIGVEGSL